MADEQNAQPSSPVPAPSAPPAAPAAPSAPARPVAAPAVPAAPAAPPEPPLPPIDMTNLYKRSESIAALALALAKAQMTIKAAAKDSTNPFFKRGDGKPAPYASLAAVWDACREPLTQNELAIVQLPSAQGKRVMLTTLLLHSSGEWIESTLLMSAAQETAQGIGGVITYARRYALSAMVGVAPEDDDGNAASNALEPGIRQDTGKRTDIQQRGSVPAAVAEGGGTNPVMSGSPTNPGPGPSQASSPVLVPPPAAPKPPTVAPPMPPAARPAPQAAPPPPPGMRPPAKAPGS